MFGLGVVIIGEFVFTPFENYWLSVRVASCAHKTPCPRRNETLLIKAATIPIQYGVVTVTRQTRFRFVLLIVSGLSPTTSLIEGSQGDQAQFMSASLTLTLNPQVVNTTGTVTGSIDLVSTLATISGSLTGTYTARWNPQPVR
jgi:hypothetical protein